MKLLALDTSSLSCTAAVTDGGRVFERYEERPRKHTRLIVPMLSSLLEEAGLEPGDLDAVVLGNGPGSFIGMRIATSVAQGFAHAAGLQIVPVSSLAAVAAAVFEAGEGRRAVVAQDAHMEEVYLGIYDAGDDGLPVAAAAERLHGQSAIDELGTGGPPAVAAGHGFRRYPKLLEANRERFAGVSEILYPSARHLLPLGRAAWRAGAGIAPEALVPAYLRHEVASGPATGAS